MSKEEDRELVEAFLAGNKNAFDKLVLKHKNMVFNLCYRIVSDYEEAEDCAQEIFIKVYKTVNKFKFQSAFATWLYRVAVNTCKNRLASRDYRNKKKTRELDCIVEGSSPSTADFTPDKEYEKKQIGAHITTAIDSLSPNHKILIVLRDIESKSYEEIAQLTGLKLGTVKSKLSRAREQLKKKLKEVIV